MTKETITSRNHWAGRTSLMASVALVAVGAFGGIAVAQDGASPDRIVVTGSRIGRSEVTSVSPISVVDAAELEMKAVSQLEDFADQLTIAPGGETNSRTNNGSGGQATISLRGLGPQRTLLLVNGRRMTPSTTNGFTDLNMIPVSAIGRIEVLRDGASTVYGSDAIAGVVNILTKDNVDGVELFAQHDRTDENDGEIYRYGLTMGGDLPDGRFTVNLEYYDRGTILQGDRDFSACPFFVNASNQLQCGGSGTAYPAQFSPTVPQGASPFFSLLPSAGGFTLSGGTVRPFTQADGYNFAERSYMVTPQEVWTGYADAEIDILSSDRWGEVSAFGELLFGHRSSQQQLAPVGTFGGFLVPGFHPNNPTGEDVNVSRRLAELSTGRFFTQDATSWRAAGGFQGELPSGIVWDASLNYGRFNDTRVVDGQMNETRLEEVFCSTAVDIAAGACANAAVTGNPNLIWDPFRTGTLNDDIANYITVRHSPVSRATRLTSQLNLAGDLGAFQLPGGPVDWAVGYEHRRDTAEFIPDGAAQLGQILFVAAEPTGGEITSTEFYGEVRLPIVTGAEFADVLAVELSMRSSNYDVQDFNTSNTNSFDSNTYKAAMEWAPNSEIRARATYNTGFRAPSIGELFQPQQQSAISYTDPCVNWGTLATGNLAANCAADGLPANFTLTSTQAAAVVGGNPNLEPEESTGYTVGLVATPSMIDGLTIGVDYFSIELTNVIGSASVNTIATACYNSANFSDPLCNLIEGPTNAIVDNAPYPGPGGARREAVGVLSGVLQTNANLSTYTTTGVDFNVDWVGPSFAIFDSSAELILGVDGTWLNELIIQDTSVTPAQDVAGFYRQGVFTTTPTAFPELMMSTTAALRGENWSLSWNGRFISEVEDISPAGNGYDTGPAIFYHDVQTTFDFGSTGLTFGVRNLLDEEPPFLENNDDMNTLQQTYDTAGRYFYARAVVRR
jgi:iron complex outermembrane receptor protein